MTSKSTKQIISFELKQKLPNSYVLDLSLYQLLLMQQLLASKRELVSDAVTITTVTMTTASNDVWQVREHPDVFGIVLSSLSHRTSSPENTVKWLDTPASSVNKVIWAKLTWRAIAAFLPPGQSCTACNKIVMCLEGVPKFEASVRKTPWISEIEI